MESQTPELPPLDKSVNKRFWSKVNKNTPHGCWEWTSSIAGNGYGSFFTKPDDSGKRHHRAHRFAWRLVNGAIPDGLWVLHKCDNRICVNPDHLFLGDRVDNMRDCAQKGRVSTIGKSKLTHCIRGHEFTPENTKISNEGWRICLSCRAINIKHSSLKRAQKRAAIRARADVGEGA